MTATAGLGEGCGSRDGPPGPRRSLKRFERPRLFVGSIDAQHLPEEFAPVAPLGLRDPFEVVGGLGWDRDVSTRIFLLVMTYR